MGMKHLRVVHKFILRYRGRFVLGVLFVIISNVFALVPAQLVRIALDLVSENIDMYKWLDGFSLQDTFYASVSAAVFVFIVMIMTMTLLKGFFMFLMRQTLIVMSRFIEYDQKNEIFNHYLKLGSSFYNRQNTGDLMNRISEDVSRVRMYYGPAIMYTINLSVLFIMVIYAMFHVNARLAWFVLVPLPVLSLLVYFVQDIINRKSEKVQAQLSAISTFVQETFSGIRVIKSFVREKEREAGFRDEAQRYRNLSLGLARTNALFFPSLLLMVGISTIMTVYIGGMEVMAGTVTLGNIAEFVIYVNMLTWPVASLGWVVSLVQRAAASQRRINEFLHTEPEIKSPSDAPLTIKGDIVFEEVSFRYPGASFDTLHEVSFRIVPGKSLAITGRTGSGKSTVAALLMRMMDVTHGRILVDGEDLRKINLDAFRRQTGFVPQDVFLFSDTIANNIAFGLDQQGDSLQMKDVEAAARKAAVYDNIMSFPKGFGTMVGERGITLSGGQKQRVSIARAIIRDPGLLVFDDCLSAVDTRTEEAILKSMRELMKGRTTLIISHRVSTVRHADEIVVLEKGKVVEKGTHAVLMRKGQVYKALHQRQLLEETGPGDPSKR